MVKIIAAKKWSNRAAAILVTGEYLSVCGIYWEHMKEDGTFGPRGPGRAKVGKYIKNMYVIPSALRNEILNRKSWREPMSPRLQEFCNDLWELAYIGTNYWFKGCLSRPCRGVGLM